MNIHLKNSVGLEKECKLGFSWTTLFFGILVPLLRGDFKWAGIMFLLSILTFGVSSLVFPFIYNKKYIVSLLEKGYFPATEEDRYQLIKSGILAGDVIPENN